MRQREYLLLVAQTAVVGVLYYGAARLGLLLQLPGTNASPVWPPSGIGLAAVLVLGWRVTPGILIAAFLANLLTLKPDEDGSTLPGLSAAAGIAFDGDFVARRDVEQRRVQAQALADDRFHARFQVAAARCHEAEVRAGAGGAVGEFGEGGRLEAAAVVRVEAGRGGEAVEE